jgi:hypothetical protein
MTTQVKTIHTLNARGNVMLEVARNYFSLSPTQMSREIQALRNEIEAVLATKGIRYDGLKSALVPDRKKREIALVFDTTRIDDGWYGLAVAKKLIPLLDKSSNHSILAGDYLGNNDNQDTRFAAMRAAVQLVRSTTFQHSSQFYIVYINNLTSAMVERIVGGLSSWEGFAGFADTTFASYFKLLLSTMLVNVCVKHGNVIIQGHEDDRSADEDVNMCGYPFEEHGYTPHTEQFTS